MRKGGWKRSIAKGGLLLAMMLPLAAVAAGVTPEAGDAAFTKLLNPIFGDNFGGGAGGAGAMDGGMASLFGKLNAAVLLVAAVVMAYTIVAGTMATAHDGAMLGKRWSSMWVPIRSAFGIGMIIPLSSGFCAAQLGVMWLVGQGVGFASAGWQEYSDRFIPAETSISMPLSGNAPNLARQMLDAQVCVARVNKEFANSTSGYATGAAGAQGELATTGGTRTYGYLGNAGAKDYCGKVVYEGVKADKAGYEKDIADRIGAAHVKATLILEQDTRQLAEEMVNSTTKMDPDAVKKRMFDATAKYLDTVDAAATAAFGDKSEFAKNQAELNGKGFVYAGFRYISSYTGASAGANAVASGPKASVTAHDAQSPGVGADVAASQAESRSWIESGLLGAKAAGDWVVDNTAGAVYRTGKNIGEFVARHAAVIEEATSAGFDIDVLSHKLGEALVSDVVSYSNSGANHYTSMISFGHQIMGSIGTLVGWLTVISLVGFVFASGFWTSPGGILFTGLVAAAYTAGVGMTMIPLIPVVFWLAWLGGYMLVVLEAMVAAPLWMVAHLSPEAEGFAGKGSNGYLLLVGVVLRPILGIIALAASFSVGTALMDIFDEVFLPMMMGSTEATGSMIGIGSVVAMIFAFMTIKMAIIAKSFNILNALPDAVMRWVGGGAAHGSLVGAQDQIAGHLDKSDMAGAAALASAVRGMGQGGGGRSGAGGGNKKKPDGDKDGSGKQNAAGSERTGPKGGDREEAKRAVDAREASGGSGGDSLSAQAEKGEEGVREKMETAAAGPMNAKVDRMTQSENRAAIDGGRTGGGSDGERGQAYPDDPISHEPSPEARERAKQAVDAREQQNARKPKEE